MALLKQKICKDCRSEGVKERRGEGRRKRVEGEIAGRDERWEGGGGGAERWRKEG